MKLPMAAEEVPEWCWAVDTLGGGLVSCTTHGAKLPVSNPPFTNTLPHGVPVAVGVRVDVKVGVLVGGVPVRVGVRVPHGG